MPAQRVVPIPITAYAVCSALGAETESTLDGLFAARSGLKTPAMPLPFETKLGAVGPLPALPSRHAKYESRVARIAYRLYSEIENKVRSAVVHWGAHRVAILIGTSTGGLAETENAIMAHTVRGAFCPDYDLHRTHSMFSTSDFLRTLAQTTGPTFALSTACSSSGKVFASAERLMACNAIDAAIVGGIDSLCQTTLRGFHSLGILSPQTCRPFGAHRNGLSLGEGGALFLLEREGKAATHLVGYGESSDGFHMSSPRPDGLGARMAMLRALDAANVQACDIDYLNAHGTGTPKNDLVECLAVASVFGEAVPVSSTKGATGHTLGAAGAIEAALTLACLEKGFLPQSLGSDPIDSEARIQIVREPRHARLRRAMSNSFGFGGSNVSLIFGAV